VSLRLSGGRRLQSPPGTLARPTSSRVRQAVINLLGARLSGCRWLDLCSGSGAMACEALQRGAAAVVAVERQRRIAAVARANLEAVARGRSDQPPVIVHGEEVLGWLGRNSPAELGMKPCLGMAAGFDLIYVDPPYAAGLYAPFAAAVLRGSWLRPDGLMLWECDALRAPALPEGWRLHDQRRYGGTGLLLLEPGSAAEGAAAAVLVPGGDEQTHQGDGNQTEHDAAEQGFDHGGGPGRGAMTNSSMMEASTASSPAQP
jgi:16S rRNA (guanine966-N2)-methyltransferase